MTNEKVSIHSPTYAPSRGSFAAYHTTPHYYSCREEFRSGSSYHNSERLLYVVDSRTKKVQVTQRRYIIALIHFVEKYLGVPGAKTTSQWTTETNVLCITPNPWWRRYILRYDFLTILIRCSQYFYERRKSNIEINMLNILAAHPYFNGSPQLSLAFVLFMNGCTCPTPNYTGNWRESLGVENGHTKLAMCPSDERLQYSITVESLPLTPGIQLDEQGNSTPKE